MSLMGHTCRVVKIGLEGYAARCSCGYDSDLYNKVNGAERCVIVHLTTYRTTEERPKKKTPI